MWPVLLHRKKQKNVLEQQQQSSFSVETIQDLGTCEATPDDWWLHYRWFPKNIFQHEGWYADHKSLHNEINHKDRLIL